jgi:hypothetical protein
VCQSSHSDKIEKHVVDKVEGIFRQREKLKKNKENKTKRSNGLQLKENEWKESLKDLFDVAHANAMERMTIEEDKQFFKPNVKKVVREKWAL